MMDVIKFDIAILSESPIIWSHSVGINITILKLFNLLFHWILHTIFPTNLTGTGPWVLRSLWVLWSNNQFYHWVFRVDFVGMYYIWIFILIYNNILFTLVIFSSKSFTLSLDDELFSNMYQDIWSIYLIPNFVLFWCFVIFY